MKNLKLQIHALRVESFDTTAIARASIGTVLGHGGALEEVLPSRPNITCSMSCLACSAACPSVATCDSGGPLCCS